MSDARLRELERRWKESGSPDDEAAHLQERARIGDLTRDRLELAAFCGHEAARKVAELPPATGVPTEWLTRIERSGRDSVVRAGLAMVRALVPLVPELRVEARDAVAAVEAWINEPSPATEGACLRAAARALRSVQAPGTLGDSVHAACRVVAELVGGRVLPAPAPPPALSRAYQWVTARDPGVTSRVDAAIRSAVSDWALGPR
jgi:hypothetical protein